MLIRIAIVDDQPEARELLRQDLLVRAPAGTSIACFDSSESFLSGFVPGDDSLIFLDICMKGMNGIEAAERVAQAKRAMPDRVFNLVQRICVRRLSDSSVDYLVKPYQTSQLEHVLSGAIRLMEESEPQVEIRMPRQTVRMPHGQIAAIASHGHTLDVFTVSGSRLISLQTFAELEAMLQGDERFLPYNRGVLVNMDEALKLDGDSIILMNGMRFPIRQRNRLEMVNRFSEYQIRRMKRG